MSKFSTKVIKYIVHFIKWSFFSPNIFLLMCLDYL
jgi:hypothetical protein